jgi:ribulose-bisphosphate carboxylase large chain
MSDAIRATYRVTSADVAGVAESICVEQTIEFPKHLAPEWIQNEVVGKVVSIEGQDVVIDFPIEASVGGFAQILNVLWGNVSMFGGVRLVDLQVPTGLCVGPRFGVDGLRELLGVPRRPLLATALKPMGLSSAELARIAGRLAAGGLDLIKDDHGLANQPWAPWRERVLACADAVHQANDQAGTSARYLPALNVGTDDIDQAVDAAVDAGVGGFLVMPGLIGFDVIGKVADRSGLPVMSHPSFLGSLVMNPVQGIDPGVLFGDLMRLAGADMSISPTFGGRFGFSEAECAGIRDRCRAPLGGVARSWPTPGGGITLQRIGVMRDFYGDDTVFLIGGALHDGDLDANVRAMAEAVRA